MEIKRALEQFLSVWNKKYGTYPTAPWAEDIDPSLYLSEPDEEKYVF